jgi:dTDP-4-dehydrorhamnose 3,5-epimerase
LSGRFGIESTALGGVTRIRRWPIADDRGWLERLFCATDLEEVVGDRAIIQINRTLTRTRGTIRGLHVQVRPSPEAKIITCLAGRILDVAVDIRKGSPTFLRWHAEELDGNDYRSIFIPEGVAHGFQALTDDCELLYLHTAAYDPAAERGFDALDPRLGIPWALPPTGMSPRDSAHPRLSDEFEGVEA